MSFSSSPMKKKFQYNLTLQQIEENTAEFEKHSKRQQDINELKEIITDLKRYEPNRSLENLQIITGAFLDMKYRLGRFDFGYLRNHLDQAIGVTKDNLMDAESEQEALAAYHYYDNQKKMVAEVIRLNTTPLSTKTISVALENEIKNFNHDSLHHVQTTDKQAGRQRFRQELIDRRRMYTESDVKTIDEKVVKHAKLVMKDIQGPAPEPQYSNLNPMNWFRSRQAARRHTAMKSVPEMEHNEEAAIRKKI